MSPWLRIDDRTADDPRILGASDAAVKAWLRLAAWCARHLTDGKIMTPAILSITTIAIAEELVTAGLLAHDNDGYRLHGDLAHVRTREEVEAEREAWRQRQAGVRRKKQSRNQSRRDTKRDLTRDSRCESDGPGPDPIPTRPDPKEEKRPLQAAGSSLPFSIADLQQALEGASNVALGGFSKKLAKAMSDAIRASGATADDLVLLRAYVDAGGLGWMNSPCGWGYLAGAAHFADLVAASKRWDADGRPPVGKNGGARRLGSAAVSDWGSAS